jgi:excisionase family DNA binding protein
MAEKWVSVSEACQLLQVSERTLYRKIKDGKIESRMTDESHREVLMAVPMTKEEIAEGHLKLASETVDNQMKIVATALGSTELVNKRMQAELDFVKTELDRVRENARSEIVRVQDHSHQQVEYIKTEMHRSRLFGLIGWAVCGALAVVLLIVSIVTVNKLSYKDTKIEVASVEVQSAKKVSDILTVRLTDKEREIRRLEGDIAAVKAELTDNKTKLAALSIQTATPISSDIKVQPFRMMSDIPATMTANSSHLTTQPFKFPAGTQPVSQPSSQPATQAAGLH